MKVIECNKCTLHKISFFFIYLC